MGIDELEDAKGGQGQQSQPSEPESSPPSEEDDKSSRVDAAKAFFRAMYAGEEPPASFGSQPQQQTAESAATTTACRKCEGLELAVKEAEQKAAESDTLYKRMAADFDNYRRRMEREREESVSLGVKKTADALLPALDDLGRAMQFLTAETPADKVIESFKLVGNRMFQCLEGVGLKRINAIGEQFDPKYHEPVQQIETEEYADGAVMQELRPGYILNDRVVRPSLVNVASNASGVVKSPAQPAAVSEPAQAEAAPAAQEIDLGNEDAPVEASAGAADLEHTVIASAENSPSVSGGQSDESRDDGPATVYELEDPGD